MKPFHTYQYTNSLKNRWWLLFKKILMCCSPPVSHSQCLQTMCLTTLFIIYQPKSIHLDLCAKRREYCIYGNLAYTSLQVFGLYTSMNEYRVRIIIFYLKQHLIVSAPWGGRGTCCLREASCKLRWVHSKFVWARCRPLQWEGCKMW